MGEEREIRIASHPMCEDSVVLGIDAAWTVKNPSGVALVQKCAGTWSLRAVECSYNRFLIRSDPTVTAERRSAGGRADVRLVLKAASSLCGGPVDLVAVDMPLSRSPICGRRASDNEISKRYGGRGCGTHSPNALRPGEISRALREGFESQDYRLCTTDVSLPGLMEVYPHPTLIELLGAERRLPYNINKARSYWPDLSPSERVTALCEQWSAIVAALDRQIVGVKAKLLFPSSDSTRGALKAYEDMLDAVVCAWVGICALEGRAQPFGDNDSAIWIPVPTVQLRRAFSRGWAKSGDSRSF